MFLKMVGLSSVIQKYVDRFQIEVVEAQQFFWKSKSSPSGFKNISEGSDKCDTWGLNFFLKISDLSFDKLKYFCEFRSIYLRVGKFSEDLKAHFWSTKIFPKLQIEVAKVQKVFWRSKSSFLQLKNIPEASDRSGWGSDIFLKVYPLLLG